MQQKNEAVQKLKSLLDAIKIAMLVTSNADAHLKARPMATADVDEEGNIWFFTNEYTQKIKEVSFNNEVMLNYAAPGTNSYVTINGTASLVNDGKKIKELWNPIYKVWFPLGQDDPNLTLLKVVPGYIEYWDGSASKVVMAVQMLKAMVTGTTFKGGEHDTIQL
jgi:general stress protein 26